MNYLGGKWADIWDFSSGIWGSYSWVPIIPNIGPLPRCAEVTLHSTRPENDMTGGIAEILYRYFYPLKKKWL
jgi:hypothetical protein